MSVQLLRHCKRDVQIGIRSDLSPYRIREGLGPLQPPQGHRRQRRGASFWKRCVPERLSTFSFELALCLSKLANVCLGVATSQRSTRWLDSLETRPWRPASARVMWRTRESHTRESHLKTALFKRGGTLSGCTAKRHDGTIHFYGVTVTLVQHVGALLVIEGSVLCVVSGSGLDFDSARLHRAKPRPRLQQRVHLRPHWYRSYHHIHQTGVWMTACIYLSPHL